jgi:rubrerythrin
MATITMADALRMALRLERENYGEYVKNAEEAQNPALRAMFSFLAAEEKKHIGIIQAKMAEHQVSE